MKTIALTLARYGLTIWIASLIIFIALRIVPGNPAHIALGINASPETIAQLEHSLGLDRPLTVQYFSWVIGLLTGHFGTSLTSGTDISPLVFDRSAVSLILVLSSMFFALVIALPAGVWAAWRTQHIDGKLIGVFSQLGIAIPSFLAAILLVALFAIKLSWLPPNGWVSPDSDFSGFCARLILPVFSLGIVQAAIMTRYVRTAILDIMHEDFMRTARAKGLSALGALRAHGLRNAALSVITVSGVQLTSLIVGAVVIEKVFVIPGLGTMLLNAVNGRDLITVQTIVMVLVVFAIVTNAVVDLLCILIDPRIRKKA
ncbi:ABC transporter permease [Corynebacterium sp. sy017]|uniref:ABC transporter permease n=1 Tax=unclassified Corynebacterium TaxID=2624378 RepID=UPI0011846D15|nr:MULTISPECIES: ABC transporter permease [unclassified Corynebacterium]MBP3088086.1 ABC transporter permease [Corynebacterium sp. sy017]TSD92611.1 ABC transporter permease [Corynebacterium sp. SY003]